MKETLVDIETYSEVDIKTCGLYRYATDPSFEILLIAWAVDNYSAMNTLLDIDKVRRCTASAVRYENL